MEIIKLEKMKKIVADEGKTLRDVNDIYVEEHIDDEGNKVEEHIPYCTEVIYLPSSLDDEEIVKMYVEEDK